MILKLIRKNRGQALVELALALPILVFLILAIIEGGRIFAGYLELQNAARGGARYASIHQTNPTAEIKNRLTLLNPNNVSIQFEKKPGADGNDIWADITLQYPMEITTPIISSLIGNPFNLKVNMSMRME